MRKLKLLFFLILFSQLAVAQSDCETIALKSQELISNCTVNQRDSIFKIVTDWEKTCGNIEPIQRIKILFDIEQNQLIDTVYSEYISILIPKYKDRYWSSQRETYLKEYLLDKLYFDFVPLRSKFDQWTAQLAKDLLQKQTQGTSEYSFCLLFSNQIELFDKEREDQQPITENNINIWNHSFNFTVLAGTLFPLGKMNTYFYPSPEIGFLAGFSITESWRIDLGLSFRIFINKKDFQLKVEDTLKNTDADLAINMGLFLSREYKFKKEFFLDIVGGFGYTMLGTNLEKSTYEEEEDKYYSIETFDASLGANLRKTIFKKHNIGLNVSAHFVPYYLDTKLKTNLGTYFFTTSLIYKF